MTNWYLLYCKRGQVLRAQEHLERQSVECFVPLLTKEKEVRGQTVSFSEPVFPNYMFVNFDPEVIHTTTISATRGVNHFVRFGSTPTVVPDDVINTLRATPDFFSEKNPQPKPGESVTIMQGIFAGMNAIYHESDGETRSILLLNLLNKSVTRSIKNSDFIQK